VNVCEGLWLGVEGQMGTQMERHMCVCRERGHGGNVCVCVERLRCGCEWRKRIQRERHAMCVWRERQFVLGHVCAW